MPLSAVHPFFYHHLSQKHPNKILLITATSICLYAYINTIYIECQSVKTLRFNNLLILYHILPSKTAYMPTYSIENVHCKGILQMLQLRSLSKIRIFNEQRYLILCPERGFYGTETRRH